jgi:hypothetical protein
MFPPFESDGAFVAFAGPSTSRRGVTSPKKSRTTGVRHGIPKNGIPLKKFGNKGFSQGFSRSGAKDLHRTAFKAIGNAARILRGRRIACWTAQASLGWKEIDPVHEDAVNRTFVRAFG